MLLDNGNDALTTTSTATAKAVASTAVITLQQTKLQQRMCMLLLLK
jgi:hypothetical protein